MHAIEAENINDALAQGINHLLTAGIEETSRNGPVLVAPGPVCTTYLRPWHRVLTSPTRDANPFFHFMETLWMLNGDNDVEFPSYFAANIKNYSDDGVIQWGAYGWRWRRFFGWDQLEAIITELKKTPDSRRCVLSMWNAMPDRFDDEPRVPRPGGQADDFYVANSGGKDVPCNTQAYFDCRGGNLNMTVLNRSNDIIWGCYGANAVHFSYLLEYMAWRINVPVGVYRQMSNNFHVYLNTFSCEKLALIAQESGMATVTPCTETFTDGFDAGLPIFMEWARSIIREPVDSLIAVPSLTSDMLRGVAVPMFLAWLYRKRKDETSAMLRAQGIYDTAWREACVAWIQRRQK